jgi:hypothetical protein
MKIIRRELARPSATVTLWLIPLMSYVLQKLGGMKMNHLEWIWWVGIPAMAILWFFVNWKIKK